MLLPSWRFFDDSAGSPRLLFRTAHGEAELGPWREFSFTQPRRLALRSLLSQPAHNLSLAHYSATERLLSELAEQAADDARDATTLVSYRLVLRLLARHGSRGSPTRLQFKLSLFEGEDPSTTAREDLLLSSVHTILPEAEP